MSQHNLSVNTKTCYFCHKENDIYCFASSTWSFVCYSCWLKNKESLSEDILIGKKNLLLLERIANEEDYEFLTNVKNEQLKLIMVFLKIALGHSLHTDI